MTSYSQIIDLQVGNVPTNNVDVQHYIDLAAEEIDSRIGFRYQTPVDVSGSSTVLRAAQLLLKRLNNQIATGRILLATFTATENQELNAYGARLVNEAQAAIEMIVLGQLSLPGAFLTDGETKEPLPGVDGTQPTTAPLLGEYDNSGSGTDLFYNGLSGHSFVQYPVPYYGYTFEP